MDRIIDFYSDSGDLRIGDTTINPGSILGFTRFKVKIDPKSWFSVRSICRMLMKYPDLTCLSEWPDHIKSNAELLVEYPYKAPGDTLPGRLESLSLKKQTIISKANITPISVEYVEDESRRKPGVRHLVMTSKYSDEPTTTVVETVSFFGCKGASGGDHLLGLAPIDDILDLNISVSNDIVVEVRDIGLEDGTGFDPELRTIRHYDNGKSTITLYELIHAFLSDIETNDFDSPTQPNTSGDMLI